MEQGLATLLAATKVRVVEKAHLRRSPQRRTELAEPLPKNCGISFTLFVASSDCCKLNKTA